MSVTDTPLHRFHRSLVEALRDRDPAALRESFTVAEIYQDLVPYRTHRDRIGVEMNGDYEHLLMRLLAGEGDLLRMESESALRAIGKQLESSNPNTTLYRDYAAAEVRLVQDRIAPQLLEDTPERVPSDEQEPAADVLRTDGGEDADERPEPAALASDAPLEAEAKPAEDVVRCRWCGETLPPSARLRFCPHCGTDTRVLPCSACGQALEPGWRYCIACGEPVGGSD